MVIKVRKRIKSLQVPLVCVESGPGDITTLYGQGSSAIAVRLTLAEMHRLVASNAPYDPQARDDYFARLRAEADRRYPCRRYGA
jgi:hypothetical protein